MRDMKCETSMRPKSASARVAGLKADLGSCVCCVCVCMSVSLSCLCEKVCLRAEYVSALHYSLASTTQETLTSSQTTYVATHNTHQL